MEIIIYERHIIVFQFLLGLNYNDKFAYHSLVSGRTTAKDLPPHIIQIRKFYDGDISTLPEIL